MNYVQTIFSFNNVTLIDMQKTFLFYILAYR